MFQSLNIKKTFLVYFISFIYLITNIYFLTENIFWLNILPLFIFIIAFSLLSLNNFLLFIVFLTPLSLPLKEFVPQLDFGMALPTEPLLFGVMLLFFLKLSIEKKFDKKILKHPISIAIFINLAWMFLTSLTSSMPIVSLKFFLARVWFLVAFYLLSSQLFINFHNIKKYIWLYMIAFSIIIIHTLIKHTELGLLDKQVAAWVMYPFFNDHTIYGAILAMFFPVLIGFIFFSDYAKKFKIFSVLMLLLFFVAIIFSYSRAAWLSLIGAFGVWIIIKLKIKFRSILIAFLSITVFLFSFWTEIFMELEKNTQDSSTDLMEHIRSMSNVSSDASNLERINRWNSALRMFEKRPILGYGPGTYMFQYAPFQRSDERTIISTNSADGGNAHSEYLSTLSESGIFGMLSFIAIIIITIYTSLQAFHKAKNKEVKMIILTSLLGLITYYLHGFLNNFLDTDKASAVFWGFTAIIVVIDVYHKNEKIIFK